MWKGIYWRESDSSGKMQVSLCINGELSESFGVDISVR